MRARISINADWLFYHGHEEALTKVLGAGQPVTLPHNAIDLPFGYFDERQYQQAFTYQRKLEFDPAWADREVFLVLDGAMANSEVFLNGRKIAEHADGYSIVRAHLTEHLHPGTNVLTVLLDGSENPEIPPFGGQIDYLTYAGLYRDAWIEVLPEVHVAELKVETPGASGATPKAILTAELRGPADGLQNARCSVDIRDDQGKLVANTEVGVDGPYFSAELIPFENVQLWTPETPSLYTLSVSLLTPEVVDKIETKFGFRTVEFSPSGFFLNGEALKLRGLNRHQSFPYVGYAMTRAAQERDAEIIRYELGCNVVRSSHYPASPWFLDHCDRIGLLVIEEIPGWQHIGGEAWKDESVRNVDRMIRRDWNHPSIIMWGVRINESADDNAFYQRTNDLARRLDHSRPTGGIRCIDNSEFLEDVYTMNDFVLGSHELGGHRGRTPLRPQREVTGLPHDVPYLVTEYNGHMFPTKSYDNEMRLDEHVRRHLEVLDAAYADETMAGCIGWCAFDYNTHADFGSGDGVCHHGVMDMFREPKFAAYVYASQVPPSERVVMEPVTHYARGERNIGGVFPLIVLTNCDEVEIAYGGAAPRRIKPDREAFPNLPFAPVIVDRTHFTEEELGEWGERWESSFLTGYVRGEKRAEVALPAKKVATSLAVAPDRLTLAPVGDCVRVMVRALDQVGRKLPYFIEPITITVRGAARLIGPATVSLRGGSVGFWIEPIGVAGQVDISVACQRLGLQNISLSAVEENAA